MSDLAWIHDCLNGAAACRAKLAKIKRGAMITSYEEYHRTRWAFWDNLNEAIKTRKAMIR